jgi:hypothetical protein
VIARQIRLADAIAESWSGGGAGLAPLGRPWRVDATPVDRAAWRADPGHHRTLSGMGAARYEVIFTLGAALATVTIQLGAAPASRVTTISGAWLAG